MTQQEILSLVQAGYTKADIDALVSTAQVEPTPVQLVAQPTQVQPQLTQAQPQPNDFLSQLAQLGAMLNNSTAQAIAQTQPVQAPVASMPQVQPAQPQEAPIAQTPSNSGLTPDEATKLFQAWSRGSASQEIELPPTAEEVLTKRFASLYGADTSKKQ